MDLNQFLEFLDQPFIIVVHPNGYGCFHGENDLREDLPNKEDYTVIKYPTLREFMIEHKFNFDFLPYCEPIANEIRVMKSNHD